MSAKLPSWQRLTKAYIEAGKHHGRTLHEIAADVGKLCGIPKLTTFVLGPHLYAKYPTVYAMARSTSAARWRAARAARYAAKTKERDLL